MHEPTHQKGRLFVSHYIYGLHLEGDDEIRYVGSTADPTKRMWGHLNEFKKRDGQKNKWIQHNLSDVRMKILEEVDSDPLGVEKAWIIKLRKQGNRLFNIRKPRRGFDKERRETVLSWLDKLDRPPSSL